VNAEIELNEKRKKRKLSKAAARELSFIRLEGEKRGPSMLIRAFPP